MTCCCHQENERCLRGWDVVVNVYYLLFHLILASAEVLQPSVKGKRVGRVFQFRATHGFRFLGGNNCFSDQYEGDGEQQWVVNFEFSIKMLQ